MLKDILKSLFENIYKPEIDPANFIKEFVSPNYRQVVDGHEIDYTGFISHIQKQREMIKSISFGFIYLVEESNKVASLHRVYVKKKDSNQEVVAEVHAFFKFENNLLVACDERTRIIKGSKEDEDLGRRK
ncbi:hypothetical protein LO80_07055 [Candidatus Francisella endociliophora]|uniref:SnoaL-like domain-containing protein n=1 Tax=Candidatus Francisella endociliophora TaxID=653937 RepID=A0A097EQC7_9GAMM|nr:nuclear transport factor 2 family protein [Francisella sp. FSC1006]AIT09746.1 hypothetical protein LO80_07055 [Francisella sp. FSC1006]